VGCFFFFAIAVPRPYLRFAGLYQSAVSLSNEKPRRAGLAES
jgi:hypothetical protein